MLERTLPHAKTMIEGVIDKNSIVVDATCGNGHDTKHLADIVSSGHVYSFDIQKTALENAQALTKEYSNITYIEDSHANVDKYIHDTIDAAMFNLGYLPKGDKSITTEYESTIEAIKKLLDILKVNGRIVIVVYHGHKEGALEWRQLEEAFINFDQKYVSVLKYQFINQKNNAPFLIVIEKKKQDINI